MKFNKEQHLIIIIVTVFIFVLWYLNKDYYNIEPFEARDDKDKRIDNDEWTFFDKLLYGGLGYGNICLPTHLFRVLLTIIFPPLGIVIKYVKINDIFPWIDLNDFISNIGEFIKSLLLTSFFYVPGLIYSLNQLKCSGENNCSV